MLPTVRSTPPHRVMAYGRGYFSGIAESRFKVLFAGATTMPTDSSAVPPNKLSYPKLEMCNGV